MFSRAQIPFSTEYKDETPQEKAQKVITWQ
jgi:hypothetical protein